jgi:16S rRNA (guanine(1405)-N(7))-methyltransferase
MAEQRPPLEQLVETVRESAKYRHICPDLVRRLGARELEKRRSLKEAVKETKNTLHQVAGAYLERTPRYATWIAALRNAPDPAVRKEITRTILAEHASTSERLPYLETFYHTVLADIPPIRSVLDVACGLNPLTLPWMPFAADAPLRYAARDIYADMMEFLDAFFLVEAIDGEAQVSDVATAAPTVEADLALILKFLPVLEQTERGTALPWLQGIRARHMLISFPTRSLGGHGRGRAEHYEGWFHELLQNEGWSARRFLFANELCFLVEK